MKDAIAKSQFKKIKNRQNSVRGVKNGKIEIMRIENGGFIRVPKPNSRLKLNTILDKYEDVKKIMGKYTTRDRPLHFENPVVPYKTHDVLVEDKQRASYLATLNNQNNQLTG